MMRPHAKKLQGEVAHPFLLNLDRSVVEVDRCFGSICNSRGKRSVRNYQLKWSECRPEFWCSNN